MRAFVEAFLESPQALLKGEGLPGRVVVLTARAPAAANDALLRLDALGDSVLWEPGRSEGMDAAWTISGRGETLRIDARGGERWKDIEARAREVWPTVIECREPGCSAPPIRLYGGGSFHPSGGDAIWAAFGDASFVLPRWVHGRCAGDAFLQLAFRSEELVDRARLSAEVNRALDALEATAPRAPSRASQPPRAAPADGQGFASWCDLVTGALNGIRAHAFEKVVAARRTYVPLDRAATGAPLLFLDRLRDDNGGCACFAFGRHDQLFFGASPERLVFAEGCEVSTEALAGSLARSPDLDSNAVLALTASEKDRREHSLVVDGIARALAPFGGTLHVPAEPTVRTLRRIHHLATPITLTLDAPRHVLSLVSALHPTPAVCGFPRAPAFEWIAEHERFDRGWYAGPVGWFDREGRGAFAVAIRSALLDADGVWVFAGAGIVERSDPSAEYAETALKQKTILSALGLAP